MGEYDGNIVRELQKNKKPQNFDIYKDDEEEEEEYLTTNRNQKKQMILFENVRIETPDRSTLLLNKFNFEISLGQNVLICGPNGAGKSAIIRVVSALWKCQSGNIKIKTKQIEDIYFLPSRSYLCPSLSVKQQILYPDIDNEHESVSDEAIIQVLSDCGLGKLVEYIDDINNNMYISDNFWSTLSDGEKQLISLCRVIIKKPKLIFIDESLSNLSMDRIQWFYKELSRLNITFVTISHSIDQIQIYHHVTLTLKGDGSGNYTVQTT